MNRNGGELALAHAALRPVFSFLSCEPLLGPVDASDAIGAGVGWIITGGESDQGSHRARPTDPAWFRSLRDQCVAAGVPFHHKQNGAWAAGEWIFDLDGRLHFRPDDNAVPVAGLSRAGADERMIWSEGDRAPEGRGFLHVGAKHSGRLLDGRVWDMRPEVPAYG